MYYEEPQLFSDKWNARTSRFAFLKALVLAFYRVSNPSATHWSTSHAYMRQHAMPDILAEWAAITGLEAAEFPWNEDEVATTWEAWRKTNKQQRGHFLDQLGLENTLFTEAMG